MLSAAVENAANEQALFYLWRRRCLRGDGINAAFRLLHWQSPTSPCSASA